MLSVVADLAVVDALDAQRDAKELQHVDGNDDECRYDKGPRSPVTPRDPARRPCVVLRPANAGGNGNDDARNLQGTSNQTSKSKSEN